jgi:HlyD family secretion protein
MNNVYGLLFFVFSLPHFSCRNSTQTTSPKTANVVESVYASGIVKSENQYEVFSKSPGVVAHIFLKEGDSVFIGTPILQIENTNSTFSAENARLVSDANDYQRNKEKRMEAKNNIDFAQKKLHHDSLMFLRQKNLWNQKIGSKVELEQRELNFENAKVNLKKAQGAYDDISRQLKLASDQSKNNLKLAQSNQNDLMVRSEVAGFIYKINAKKGEMSAPTFPLAVVGQTGFVLELNVDELDIVKIRKGQKLIVRMDSYKNQVFEASVRFVFPMMDPRTRTFKVEAVFTKPPEPLYPNLTLEANIIINVKNKALTIPTQYLVNDSTVMLENGDLHSVKIGLKDFDIAEVISGIDVDTKIRMPTK